MIIRLEMKNYIMILTENQQKISALSSGKIDKYEYLTGEEILSSDQRRVIKQGKFTYSLLGKVFEKQTKMIEEQGWKQIEAIEEHGKQLDLIWFLKEKKLDRQELIILKNYVIVFNFQNLIYYPNGPTKYIALNNFIDGQIFLMVKVKKYKIWRYKKVKWNFNRNEVV